MIREEHSLMAELARIFDDDETCCSATAHPAASASSQHPLAGGYAPPSCSHMHAGKGCANVQDDPFLLPGDETTWLLDEWSWDPFSLSAAPRKQLQHGMQPVSKRQKLQDGTNQAAHAGACSMLHPAALAPSLPSVACSSHAGEHRRPAGDPHASSCCTFQMPSMHLPTAPMANQAALKQQQQQGSRAATWAATGMLRNVPWGDQGVAGGMLPPVSAASMSLSAMDGGQDNAMALAGMPGSSQHLAPASLPETQQQHMLHNSLAPSMPPVAHTGRMMQQADALAAAAVASAAMGAATPGPAVTPSSLHASPKPVPPSSLPVMHAAAPNQATACATSMPTSACLPDTQAAIAAGADSGDESDAGMHAPTGKASTNSSAARKGLSLPPATYTGSLQDVVTLNDTCVDEANRMKCQVAGCGKDLSGLKEYHQRYRICEVHIKLPQVLKDGRLQRFCQQCGRFHDLSAFDAGRKSCREQLSKHNARRRRRAQMESQKAKALEQLSSAVPVTAVAAVAGAGDPPGGGGTAASLLDATGAATNDVGRLLSALMTNPAQLAALRLLLGVQTHPALPPLQPFTPESAVSGGSGGMVGMDTSGELVSAPPTYGLAREVVDSKGVWAPNFESDHQVLRISMKLFNRTPSDLPPDLRQHVTSWLSSMPSGVSGAIRPGCVFLTLQLLLDTPTYKDALRRGLASLLRHLRTTTGCPFWNEGVYVVQLAGEMALLVGGCVTAYHREASCVAPAEEVQAVEASTPCTQATACAGAASAPGRAYPHTTSLSQLCVPAPTGSSVQKVAVQLHGTHLDTAGVELVVRQGSTQLRQTLWADGLSTFTGEVPVMPLHTMGASEQAVKCGIVWLEVQRGAWLGPAHPLLVVDDLALAAEVQQLAEPTCKAQLSSSAKQMLLVDLGMVLAHTSSTADCFQGVVHQHVARKARQLLLFACDMGWAAVAARVLPLATANCACAQEVIQAVHASSASPSVTQLGSTEVNSTGSGQHIPCSSEASNESTQSDRHTAQAEGGGKQRGLSLLHRVVRSGNLTLLQGVLHWGQVSGYKWRADRNGPGGVTPLHLAALQEDPRVLLALLDYAPPGAFTTLQAQDGTTPFHLGFQMGHFTLDSLASQLHKEQLLPETAATSTSRHGSGGCAPVDLAPVAKAAVAAIQSLNGGMDVQPEVYTASASGAELDPCERCQCRLPPLMLSIAAACAMCGERVPCLGGLSSQHASSSSKGTAAGRVAEALLRHVPGHDTTHCAGCQTAHLLQCSPCAGLHEHDMAASMGMRAAVGHKRTLWSTYMPELHQTDLPALADSANNCAGYDTLYEDVCMNNQHPLAAAACVHQHGSVYSVTAMCQGCHANRVLEVV